jgi:hypothetical protein
MILVHDLHRIWEPRPWRDQRPYNMVAPTSGRARWVKDGGQFVCLDLFDWWFGYAKPPFGFV